MIKKIKKWIKDWKTKRRMKKRIAELKKNDPFTYRH
jgi:hypothetical protein